MPERTSTTEQSLCVISRKSVTAWEILALFLSGIVLVAILWFLVPMSRLWGLLICADAAALLFAEIFYLPALYRSLSYSVSDRWVERDGGVILHRRQRILRDRIVYVTVTVSLLDRLLGLATLTVAAPGATVRLSYLYRDSASKLALLLSPARQDPNREAAP